MYRLESRRNGGSVVAAFKIEVQMNVIAIKRVCSVLNRVLLDQVRDATVSLAFRPYHLRIRPTEKESIAYQAKTVIIVRVADQ